MHRTEGVKIKRKRKSAVRCVNHHALGSKTASQGSEKKTGATLSLLGQSFQLPGTGHCQEPESEPGVTLHVLFSSIRTTIAGKNT